MYVLNNLESLDRGDENHIVINGDNLNVLKALRFTHKGKFQAILIDPPYGTGNDGFKFNDRYARTEFSAMIRPVLALAYELLSDTGFIAVNFDNGQFRLVTEEALRDIFGYKNQIATLVWPTKQPSPNARNFWVQDEPIFLYAKDIDKFKSNPYPSKYVEVDEAKDKKEYPNEDEVGRFKTQPIRDWNTRTTSYREGSPSRWFPMVAPDGTEIYPVDNKGVEKAWRWSLKKYEEEKDTIFWKKNKDDKWEAHKKLYRPEVPNKKWHTILDASIVKTSSHGKTTLGNVLGNNTFDYPKPVELIKFLLEFGSTKDGLVLDFFAGSGTTGQAVAELNNEDGGTRQVVLVTDDGQGDADIFNTYTVPRMKRVLTGDWSNGKGKPINGSLHTLKAVDVPVDESSEDTITEDLSPHIVGLVSLMENSYKVKFEDDEVVVLEGDHTVVVLKDIFGVHMLDQLITKYSADVVYVSSVDLVRGVASKHPECKFKNIFQDYVLSYNSSTNIANRFKESE